MDESDARLHDYYELLSVEADRLSRREGRLEFERTKESIARYLTATPSRILDIGGGTGVYSAWLASLGHNVHMIDIVESHIRAASAVGSFSASPGDARRLVDADGHYDVVLLLGPMYHLPNAADRLQALGEARRVSRRGGLIVAAYISRPAIPLDGFVKGWIHRGRGLAAMQNVARSGHDAEGTFGSIAYFHQPSEIEPELRTAGLTLDAMLGVEGPGWIAPDFDARWDDEEGRRVILETARACEANPELLVLSAHILAIARNPT
jgi:2-polyprenyl-3-methyl-5-hydroxy-6-metoxy-1,4-benzoquinol methylase